LKEEKPLNISTDNTETVKKMLSEGMNATQISKALGKSRIWVKEMLNKFRKTTDKFDKSDYGEN
jgi:transposase